MEKILGKISSIYFGLGGYQGATLGLHISFSMTGSGVSTSISAWDYENIKHTKNCQWDEDARTEQYIKIIKQISKYLSEAKVDRIEKLNGVPVEITMEGNCLKEWRILTEVI